MKTQKMLALGAAGFLILAGLPLMAMTTTADKHAEQGNLSRTFFTYTWVDFKQDRDAPGLGWFDPDNRDNNCLIRTFGVNAGSGLYYTEGRVVVGEAANEKLQIQVNELFLGVGCPFTTANNDADIGWTTFNLYAGIGVSQIHLMCLDTFSTCTPKPDTAEWFLIVCKEPADQVNFGADGDIIGAHLSPFFDGPIQTGSTHVDKCGGEDKNPEPNKIDVTEFLTEESNRRTSQPVPVEWIMNPPGKPEKKDDNSRYVISCYQVEYFKPGHNGLAQSHDWFLVLKGGDAGAALLHHLDNNLQGLYDLSGDNGCPQKDGNLVELDRNAKAPLIDLP